MQNPIQKFRQSSIVFEIPGFCLKIWKLWRAPTTLQFNFFLKLRARFLLTNVYKRVWDIFLFCLDLELFAKDLVSTHSFFTLLLISQDLNKIKKIPHHFVDTTKYKTSAKFQQKILNSVVVGALQSFQFIRQNTWFLRNNRGLP